MISRRYLILLFVALVLNACEKKNPEDADAAFTCSADEQCTSIEKICDVAEGTCVSCLREGAGPSGICEGTTPFCGEGNICRACSTHDECKSGICLENGECLDEARISYAVQDATGTECTKDVPCGSLGAALGKTSAIRPYVKVTGTFTGNTEIAGKIATVYGAKGATLSGGETGPVLTINQMGSETDVTLIGLKISGSKDAQGILLNRGEITVIGSEISGNKLEGIRLNDGELTVSRSRISKNERGGIYSQDDKRISISNNFIIGNTGEGGVFVRRPANSSKIQFNTIVDNTHARSGSTDAGGILCDNASVSLSGNIIYRNISGNTSASQTAGMCPITGAFVLSATASDNTLMFGGDDNYHLTAASPATVRDSAGVTCMGTKDFDGDGRPQGVACDMGADEFKVP